MFLKLIGMQSYHRAEFAAPVMRDQVIQVEDEALANELLDDGYYNGDEGDDENFVPFWREVEDPRKAEVRTGRRSNRLSPAATAAKDAENAEIANGSTAAAKPTDGAEVAADESNEGDANDGEAGSKEATARAKTAAATAQRRTR